MELQQEDSINECKPRMLFLKALFKTMMKPIMYWLV